MKLEDNISIFNFLFIFLPGFIALTSSGFFFPSRKYDFSKQWFEAISYGVVFSILTGVVYSYWPNIIVIFIFMIMLPIVSPYFIRKILNSEFIAEKIILPIPKSWDYIFGQKKIYWIIIYLKNGEKVAGLYSSNSYTSSYPEPHDIYIEENWNFREVDGKKIFEEKVERTEGMWIAAGEISRIEFFKYKGEE